MHRALVTTEDGSHTIFVKELAEQYHSLHGAIQESDHVFIKGGLDLLLESKDNINILEVGFGTGLNALLTFLNTTKSNISYTAIEPFPISNDMAKSLNYTELLDCDKGVFTRMHQELWNQLIVLRKNFSLFKTKQKVQDFLVQDKFDLVYFDAFAPQIQPELWTKAIFDRINSQLYPGGILMTYCAKGAVKRALKESGFNIESLPGPPGKREITRAMKRS